MSVHTIKYSIYFIFIVQFFTGAALAGSDSEKIQTILASDKAPSGVVFEIAMADPDALRWAIPRIKQYAVSLRKKFPNLELAVVTHGREQFALQKGVSAKYRKVQKQVEQLSKSDDIPVHVCQTFAAWNDVEPEDFPEYITVSATGPQQVNDYLSLGYTLIKIRGQ